MKAIDKIKVVIIGAGNIASGYDTPDSQDILTHSHAIRLSEYFMLAGFIDENRNKSENAAIKWETDCIDSLQSIRDDKLIVCCATPDETHYDVLKELSQQDFLEAVICEKPLCDSYEHAKAILDMYRDRKIPLIVNYSRRFIGAFREAKRWIDSAGDLIAGSCYYGKGLFHTASHMINILDYLIDLKGFRVQYAIEEVIDYSKTDKSISFALAADDARIDFHVIPDTSVTVFEFDLLFTNGRIKYDDSNGELLFYHLGNSNIFKQDIIYKPTSRVYINRSEALVGLYDNLYDYIIGRAELLSDGDSAAETIKICERINQCMTEDKNE